LLVGFVLVGCLPLAVSYGIQSAKVQKYYPECNQTTGSLGDQQPCVDAIAKKEGGYRWEMGFATKRTEIAGCAAVGVEGAFVGVPVVCENVR
jgi:hypothetical protein